MVNEATILYIWLPRPLEQQGQSPDQHRGDDHRKLAGWPQAAGFGAGR